MLRNKGGGGTIEEGEWEGGGLLVSVMSNFKTGYTAVEANLRRNRRFFFTELT